MENKKILILGSSGFLGSHLVKFLLKNNEVVQFDMNPPPQKIADSEFIKGSILDKTLVTSAMKDVDIVYHFAAMTDIDIVNESPAQAIEVNIAGTSNVLEACVQERIERFIFSSSVYVYSEFGGVYKSTKQACELLIEDYNEMHGIGYTILQLGSVYGPGAKQINLISRLINEALSSKKIHHYGTGEEIRQYIYVNDVIQAAATSIDKNYKNKKIILLGNERITISELMDKIIFHTDSNIQKVFHDDQYGIHYKLSPFHTNPDGAVSLKIETPVLLNSGLKKTINAIKKELNL